MCASSARLAAVRCRYIDGDLILRLCAPRKTEKELRANDHEREGGGRERERGEGKHREIEKEEKKSEKRDRAPCRMLKKASSS